MKKLFLFAATAMLFAACTNEEEITPQLAQETALENGAVGFDVYVPGSTAQTRSGRVNVMTTNTLKKTGFGIFAYQSDNGTNTTPGKYSADDYVPDYMWNQQVFYDGTALSWYYAPLKYWPNETNNDSQSSQAGMPTVGTKNYMDRLSFFAYAPWVLSENNGTTTKPIYTDVEAAANVGIVQMTGNDGVCDDYSNGKFDPRLRYQVARDPNQSVDLLWGVAPAGGLNYTGVDGKPVQIAEGKPLIDLWKPATNTNLKFMFQHALARIGVKVVLAADQLAAGGYFDYGNTKVTIEDIAIKGEFGLNGFLNLNNTVANEANWEIVTDANDDGRALHLNATNGLAEHLRYSSGKENANEQQAVTGVTTSLADAIKGSTINDAAYDKTGNTSDFSRKVENPAYSATTPYFDGPFEHVSSAFKSYYAGWSEGSYLWMYKASNGSYTTFDPSITYPNATVFENVYTLTSSSAVVTIDGSNKTTYKNSTAYRQNGRTFTPTGQVPEVGDKVFTETPVPYTGPASSNPSTKYLALPNYFMVIPTQADNQQITVKINYHVSTIDPNLANNIVYTQNVVEKTITLPHMKNGYSYNLKLILGMTSVKVEAEVADWTTTEAEIYLPQNTTE